MPQKQKVFIETSQTITAFVEGPNGGDKPAAKLVAGADGVIKVWLAGHDPVELTAEDLGPLSELFITAAALVSIGEFDPSDPEELVQEREDLAPEAEPTRVLRNPAGQAVRQSSADN